MFATYVTGTIRGAGLVCRPWSQPVLRCAKGFDHIIEKDCSVGATDDSMVCGQGQGDHGADPRLAVHRHDPVRDWNRSTMSVPL